jgi:hypothetical protein
LQKLRDEKLAAEKERKAAEVPCPDIFFGLMGRRPGLKQHELG